MNPTTHDTTPRFGTEEGLPGFPADIEIHPLLIEFCVARGRRMRAEAFGEMGRAIGDGLRRLFSRPGPARAVRASARADFLATVAGGLRTPLTSIRSSAEILRDNPDLPLDQRNRFLDVVLAEDERLTRLIDAILDASEVEGAQRRWQIRTESLEKRSAGEAA